MNMPLRDSIVLNENDYHKLVSLIDSVEFNIAAGLNSELLRADVVTDAEFPLDAVAMNSVVTFEDLNSGEATTITLVYPHESDVEQMKISILSPVGTALLGLRIGEVIDWGMPNGKNRLLKVTEVARREEAAHG